MLVPLLIATVVSLLASSVVLLGQAFSARNEEQKLYRQQQILDLATKHPEGVTIDDVAAALSMPPREADLLLRSMVDDTQFTMRIDDTQGVLRFAIPSVPVPRSKTRAR